MSHALVVGGTGMLRGVVLRLAGSFDAVTVLARLRSIRAPRVTTMHVDWHDATAFRTTLARVAPVDLAVCWIHSSAPDAPLAVAERIARRERPPALYQVFGSASDATQDVKQHWRTTLAAFPGIDYRTVTLGRIGARWLDDQEIAAGVLEAIDRGAKHYDVGVVD